MSPLKDIEEEELYKKTKKVMEHLKAESMKEPKKPDMIYLSPIQQLKALAEYKTARNRWLKQLKHVKSGSVKVDYSIAAHKQEKRYRKMKDSTWKNEQKNRIPQSTIDGFFKSKKKEKEKDV